MGIKTRVCQHLQSVGLNPKDANLFASLIGKWANCSGLEWTAERVKSLQTSLLKMLESGEYYIPPGWASKRTRKYDQSFSLGVIHRLLTSDLSIETNRMRLRALIRTADLLILERVSKKQIQKFKTAVTGESNSDPRTLRNYEVAGVRMEIRRLRREKPKDLGTLTLPGFLNPNSEKRSPSWSPKTGFKTYPRSDARAADFYGYASYDSDMQYLIRNFPRQFAKAITGDENSTHVLPGRPGISSLHERSPDLKRLPAGKILVLQEGGCKARWIANPILLLQALGEPSKRKLNQYTLDVYPEVMTHDQDKGRDIVRRWLEEGRTVHSIDLSSFTDRFPFKFQQNLMALLKEDGVLDEFDTAVINTVCTKPWDSELGEVTWRIGQPLGFGPSFHLATLAHAVLADNLNKSLCQGKGKFMIVGDDIVIQGDELARHYRNVVAALGVEISPTKGLISKHYADFLGKIISSRGVTPTIKTKFLDNPEVTRTALAFYGRRGMGFLSNREKLHALGAFVPTWLGGLGWRPTQMSYKNYLESLKTEDIQYDSILSDIMEFYDLDSVGSLEARLNLMSTFYRRNVVQMPSNARFMVKGSINEFSGIPITSTRPSVERLEAYRTPSFVNLVDTENIHSLTNNFLRTANRLESTRLLNAFGYINDDESHNPKEKPYVGQNFRYSSQPRDERGSPQPERYLRREVYERSLGYCEEGNREDGAQASVPSKPQF